MRAVVLALWLALTGALALAQSPASSTIYTGSWNGQVRSGTSHAGVCSQLMSVVAASDSSIVKYHAYWFNVGQGDQPFCAFQTAQQSGESGKYAAQLSVSQGCSADTTIPLSFMAGWGYSATDSESNSVPGTNPSKPDPYCDGTCSFAQTEVTDCAIDQEPSSNGYFRYTCTYAYTSTGSTCTVADQPPETPEPTDPNPGPDPDPTCGGEGQPACDPDPDPDPDCGGEGQPACDPDPGGGGECGGEGQPACNPDPGECGGEGQPACDPDPDPGGGGVTCPTGQVSDGSGGCVPGPGGGDGDGEGDSLLCELFPDVFACQTMGSAGDAVPLANSELGSSVVTPVGGFGPSNAACPSAQTVVTSVGTFSLPWDAVCQWADTVRPIVIALAWLSAMLGVVAFVRN